MFHLQEGMAKGTLYGRKCEFGARSSRNADGMTDRTMQSDWLKGRSRNVFRVEGSV